MNQNIMDIILQIYEIIKADAYLYGLLFLFSSWLLLRIIRRQKRVKVNKKLFFNTGFKISFSAWDRIKFKLRLGDFDDTHGVRYIYLISIKIFGFEFFRTKYFNQEGKVYKRTIKFGG